MNARPELGLRSDLHGRNDPLEEDEDDSPYHETEDESEDGFGPIRGKRQPRSVSRRSLGPPITIDEKLERLNDIHRMVVEDFLSSAKELSQKVSSLHLQHHL